MAHATDPATRETMMRGAQLRYVSNEPIFREVILLRDEHAREIGFTSHAEAMLVYRSVESTQWIEVLMQSLTQAMLPARARTMSTMAQMKLDDTGRTELPSNDDTATIQPWDYKFYNEKLQHEHNIDSAAIEEYFPLHHTFQAMLEIFADCLKLQFQPLLASDLQNCSWHPDVQGWSVWDDGQNGENNFVGYLFADLQSRDDKYKGNQSVNLQPSFLWPDGTRCYPANVLMCNFSNKDTETGCLLGHKNVTTLFHELGHSIHSLVSRTQNVALHGYNVTLEFGEAIGMMLEQYTWLPAILQRISLHYSHTKPEYAEAWQKHHPGRELPPRDIPLSLLEPLLAECQSRRIERIMEILLDARFDMIVHNPSSREALLALDPASAYTQLSEEIRLRPHLENSTEYVSYGHLFAGYSGGYYSYICAEVFGADMFVNGFAHDPLDPTAWERFRNTILQPGGTRPGMDLLREFLGREPDTRALLQQLGLDAA